ncbi:MAG: 4-carboxymuconolactone decarboxylase [Gemmatimonadaceae bacterium]|jgi:4-carboxymuconolactone decarboxylase|nr:4-carboxymuconolactone decarboxylase [Gemmatimonadaceae bacterium]
MTTGAEARLTLASIEVGLRHLVRIAGAIAGSPEGQVRSLMSEALDEVDPIQVEEIILQSYLFAGFPRTLNAMRMWRVVSERPAPSIDPEAAAEDFDLWRTRGAETCAIVYGESYEKLRQNVCDLHPALDEWMIVDGYGKVLSRPGVDLRTRELCVVAACAVSGQQRQLHSHLHGALNSGSSVGEIAAVLDALGDLISRDDLARYRQLLQKVQAQ